MQTVHTCTLYVVITEQLLVYTRKHFPRWKGSRVSSPVREYSQEIRDIRAPNHAEITRNTRPSTRDDSARYTCTYSCEKHWILRVTRGTIRASTTQRRWDILWSTRGTRASVSWHGGSVKWRANSACTRCACEYTISSCAACALRKPFPPGLAILSCCVAQM